MIQKFWNTYLTEKKVSAVLKGTICFGDSHEAADAAAEAVCCGKKTVMSYPENGYRTAMKGMPAVGDRNIVVNWAGEPVCVIETVKVFNVRFNSVVEEICAAEMLGENWKGAKEAECKRELEELGGEFDENITLVVEEFRSIYPEQA